MPAVPVFPGLVIHAADASVLMTKGVLEAGVSKSLSQQKLLHLLFFPFKMQAEIHRFRIGQVGALR